MSKHSNAMRRRLDQIKKMTAKATAAAMNAASESLDRQLQEIAALKRILISERAQVIYYTDKYLSFVTRNCVELVAKPFLDLPEEAQTGYIKRAIEELSEDRGVVPHQQPEKVQTKGIILPN